MRRLVLLLLCLFLGFGLTACVTTQRNLEVAPDGEQSIHMWHKPSGESISVTYRIGGHYVPEAFAQIDHLFRDRRTGEETAVDPALIDVIADLRDKMIMPPDTPIELTSGYRSPESNAYLAKYNKHVAKSSYHTRGQAADIRIPDMNSRVLELVATTMQRGGVALYPDSGHVHVDVGPVRGWAVKPGREDGTANEGPTQPSARRSGETGRAVAPTNLKTRKAPFTPPAEVMSVPLAPKKGSAPTEMRAPNPAPVKSKSLKAPPAAKGGAKGGAGAKDRIKGGAKAAPAKAAPAKKAGARTGAKPAVKPAAAAAKGAKKP